MVSTGQFLGFALTCLIVIAIPGPSVLFVIGRALAHGRRTALASVAGNVAGVQVVAISVALGVGTLVQRSDLVFTAVKLGGASYLVWLGVKAIRHRRSLSSALEVAVAPKSTWGVAASGVRSWFARSPHRLELVGGLGGLTMIGLGVTLALTGRKD